MYTLRNAFFFAILLATCVLATLQAHAHFWGTLSGVRIPVWAVFYSVFGVVYAILMGFILAELLNRFHRILRDIGNEVNDLQCIRDFLIYVNGNEQNKDRVVNAIDSYVDSVLEREWDEMRRKDRSAASADTDTSDEIYDIMRGVESIDCHDQSDIAVIDRMIGKLADITRYRTDRYEQSSEHLSPLLRGLMLFMSSVVVIGLILVPVGNIYLHIFVVASMFTAVFLLTLVIEDLNHPYDGLWNISTASFHDMKEKMKSHWPEYVKGEREHGDVRHQTADQGVQSKAARRTGTLDPGIDPERR